MDHSGKKNTKVDCNSSSCIGCVNCSSISRNIETFPRADGTVLMLDYLQPVSYSVWLSTKIALPVLLMFLLVYEDIDALILRIKYVHWVIGFEIA